MSRTASSLAACLESSARRFPDRPAVVDSDGASSYRELNEQAGSIAAFLIDQGVAPGDRVGILLPKSRQAVAAIFGVLKARAVYVPADWSAPVARVRSIFEDCQVRLAFVNTQLASVLSPGVPIRVAVGPGQLDAGAIPWEQALSHSPVPDGHAAWSPDDLAYILYTSGSTGIPKGVMLSQRNALSFVDWCSSVFRPDEHDRFSSHAPFHFDLSVLDLYVSVKHGASVHLISDELGKSPRELAAFISEHRLTVWYSTPSTLSLLAEFGNLHRHDFDALRLVLFAGEVFPVKHLRNLVRLWPRPTYYNLYGPTETNVCTYARIPLPIPPERIDPYPIGWPCSHCTPLVLDEAHNEVKAGEEGALFIAGPSVFKGYWNRPQENSCAFVERGGARWYNTGDVVREDPGQGLVYLGRRDRMVKRRGYRIELDEIECVLYRHEQIREAGVVAVPDSGTGTRIVAFLVAASGRRPSLVEMKTTCSRHLPVYMVPDTFHFVDKLPRTSTNKVNYPELVRSLQALP